MQERYLNVNEQNPRFSVSCQHYSFAVNAFVDVIRKFDARKYDFTLRETQTYEIIEDVAKLKSEIGILYTSSQNETIIMKLIRQNDLKFEELFVAKPHVFISSKHPLADREALTLEDLEEYPYLSFEQGDYNSFYFSEEILKFRSASKSVTTYMNLRTHKTFRKLEKRLFPFGKDDANGKWLIVSVVALILLLITSSRTYGQVVTSNPGEYTILATGNNLINGTVKSETQAQRNTALAQNAMAGEFTKMKQWEKDYNSYLKTATNYASALKAGDIKWKLFSFMCKNRQFCSK